jgi:cytochrome c-type biogenesis protein CcmE
VIALAIIYLIFTVTPEHRRLLLTVEELHDKAAIVQGRNVRVSGKVVGDSIDFNSRDLVLRFEIVGENGQTLPVVFNGPKPDQMRQDAEAIIQGSTTERSSPPRNFCSNVLALRGERLQRRKGQGRLLVAVLLT